jgi:hypothetical protein
LTRGFSFSAMYSIVALNIHSPQLGKVGKYKRGKFGVFKLFLLSTMTQLISKYLGSPTGFCVGLLLKLRWFSPIPPVSSTNKPEILLKVALKTITITQTNSHIPVQYQSIVFIVCNLFMLYRIHLAWAGFKLAKVGTDCMVFINPTTIRLLCLAKSVKGLIIHMVRKFCLSADNELTLPLGRCSLQCTNFYTSRNHIWTTGNSDIQKV